MKILIALSILLTPVVFASEENSSFRESVISVGMSITLSRLVENCTTLFPESENEFGALFDAWLLANSRSIERGKETLEELSLENDYDFNRLLSDKARQWGQLKNASIEDQRIECDSVMEWLIDGA